MIHLDTNVAIALLNDRQPLVRQRFDAVRAAGTPMALSMIVYHELL
jgi:tRNA(fMet)-specific endonuclease VapC